MKCVVLLICISAALGARVPLEANTIDCTVAPPDPSPYESVDVLHGLLGSDELFDALEKALKTYDSEHAWKQEEVESTYALATTAEQKKIVDEILYLRVYGEQCVETRTNNKRAAARLPFPDDPTNVDCSQIPPQEITDLLSNPGKWEKMLEEALPKFTEIFQHHSCPVVVGSRRTHFVHDPLECLTNTYLELLRNSEVHTKKRWDDAATEELMNSDITDEEKKAVKYVGSDAVGSDTDVSASAVRIARAAAFPEDPTNVDCSQPLPQEITDLQANPEKWNEVLKDALPKFTEILQHHLTWDHAAIEELMNSDITEEQKKAVKYLIYEYIYVKTCADKPPGGGRVARQALPGDDPTVVDCSQKLPRDIVTTVADAEKWHRNLGIAVLTKLGSLLKQFTQSETFTWNQKEVALLLNDNINDEERTIIKYVIYEYSYIAQCVMEGSGRSKRRVDVDVDVDLGIIGEAIETILAKLTGYQRLKVIDDLKNNATRKARVGEKQSVDVDVNVDLSAIRKVLEKILAPLTGGQKEKVISNLEENTLPSGLARQVARPARAAQRENRARTAAPKSPQLGAFSGAVDMDFEPLNNPPNTFDNRESRDSNLGLLPFLGSRVGNLPYGPRFGGAAGRSRRSLTDWIPNPLSFLTSRLPSPWTFIQTLNEYGNPTTTSTTTTTTPAPATPRPIPVRPPPRGAGGAGAGRGGAGGRVGETGTGAARGAGRGGAGGQVAGAGGNGGAGGRRPVPNGRRPPPINQNQRG